MKRLIERLAYGWQFAKGEINRAPYPDCPYQHWETVRVPHDWAIEGPFDTQNDKGNLIPGADGYPASGKVQGRTGALPCAGVAWYRKEIFLKEEYRECTVCIEFDGVMDNSTVYMNGICVGGRHYGYTSFCVDVTKQVEFGASNLLAVKVDQRNQSSRWYPGAGIYRNVRLVVKHTTHIAYHATYITTPEVTDEQATVSVQTQIVNPNEKTIMIATLFAPDGTQLEKQTLPATDTRFQTQFTVKNPQTWSHKTPILYTVELRLKETHTPLDDETVRIGLRKLTFDGEKGFFVNGEYTRLHGVCMHHDLGALGAAVNRSALRRQLHIMQEMGCNAIRTSHNPPAPELLELADEMGFYIIVEQFDQWRERKTAFSYSRYFDEWAESDLTATIRRDRNHPCVIMWSIGNEIVDQNVPKGAETAHFLNDICHREDPSRPTTAGFNTDGAIQNKLTEEVDIVGWNYRPHLYRKYREDTNWIMYGSETESCISSRGVYYIPEAKTDFSESIQGKADPNILYPYCELPVRARPEAQVSSYDLSAPAWAYYPEIEFAAQDDCPFIFGEFVWTGFDYLGEPTPYGWSNSYFARSSYFGIVDLAGIPKDRYYSYMAKWTNKEVLHLFPHWNWNDGDVLPVHCYSSYDRAELFVNGKSYGIRQKEPNSKDPLKRYRLIWENVVFEAGELTVKALDENGKILKTETVCTAGEPASIELTADREAYTDDGEDCCFITARLLDKDGHFCPTANNRLTFTVTGQGEFLAADNGDPTDVDLFQDPDRDAFSGCAVGIFRTLKNRKGVMRISVSAENLPTATLNVLVK